MKTTDFDRLAQEIAQGQGLTLSQAAKRFPSARKDRPVSGSCVFRWSSTGARTTDGQRVKLETCRVAGRLLTTEAAIFRFIAAQQGHTQDTTTAPRSAAKQQRASEHAAAELEKIGI